MSGLLGIDDDPLRSASGLLGDMTGITDMPPPGARVPADTASDVGPVVMGHWIEPVNAARWPVDVGSETTPEIRSNEEAADVATRQQMKDTMAQLDAMMSAGTTYSNRAKFNALLDAYKALGAQSPSYRYEGRVRDVRKAAPGDADVIQQAIERRRGLGRSE